MKKKLVLSTLLILVCWGTAFAVMISGVGDNNTSPALSTYLEGETGAGVSEHFTIGNMFSTVLGSSYDSSAEFDALFAAKEDQLNNSAGLLAALSDETGTGLAVFGTSPTIATPTFTTSITIGSAGIDETELEILDGATLSTTDLNIIDGISDSGSLTAAELLYVDGVSSGIQAQINAKEGQLNNSAGLANAISDEQGTGFVVFNGSPTIATPTFTTSITIGGAGISETELEILDGATLSTTQLNYLTSATGTTGTTSTNLVFSTSPTLVTPNLGAVAAGSTWNLADTITALSVYTGTTSLDETTAADDSGAYIIGVYTGDIASSAEDDVQGILDDFDDIFVGLPSVYEGIDSAIMKTDERETTTVIHTQYGMSLTSLSAAPTGDDLVAGALYRTDGDPWDPTGGGLTEEHTVQYTGSDWKLVRTDAGVQYIESIEVPTIESDEMDDANQTTPFDVIAAELKNTILSNAGAVGAWEYDFPAKSEGWNFMFIIEAAQNVTLDTNGTEQWYMNGSQMAAGEDIVFTAGAVGCSLSCISTENNVFCTSSDAAWDEATP